MKQEPTFKFDLEDSFPHLTDAPIVEAVIHWVARRENPLSQAEWRNQLTEPLPDYLRTQASSRLFPIQKEVVARDE